MACRLRGPSVAEGYGGQVDGRFGTVVDGDGMGEGFHLWEEGTEFPFLEGGGGSQKFGTSTRGNGPSLFGRAHATHLSSDLLAFISDASEKVSGEKLPAAESINS